MIDFRYGKLIFKFIIFTLCGICFSVVVFSKNNFDEKYNTVATSFYKDDSIIEKNISNGFAQPTNIFILNTREDDFAPFYNDYTNELFFNSVHQGYSKYFVAKMDSLFNFQSVKLSSSLLNEPRQNRSYMTLIDEKQALVCAFNHTVQGSFLNLYKSIFERNAWAAPTPLSEYFIDTCFIAHPTISPNGQMLIFSSDKNNYYKNTDLWVAYKQADGSWDMIVPIDELNSNGNEITPYLISDSLLIFASDGFEGIGGYDLYYSFYSAGKWSKPQPVEGVNSEFNESDPTLLPNATLVFASDRPNGKGKLDLYAASIIINDVIQTEIPFTVSATNLNVEINKLTKYDLVADTTIITENTQEISFSTLPPAIQFFVKIDSIYFQNTIKQNSKDYKIIYKLIADNKLLEEKEFDILKKDFIINIENHSNKIFEADILEIEVSIKILSSKECNIISKKNTINIAKSEKNELKKHKSGSEEYYRVLTIVNNNIDTYKLENTEILSEIKNLIEFSPKINIFINNADTKFTNEIKKIFNNNRNINIVKPSDEQLQYIEYHIFLAR